MSKSTADQLSYHHTPMLEPYIFDTIPNQLTKLAKQFPSKEAFVIRRPGEEREAITFSQLASKVKIFAMHLVLNGVKPGDFIGIFVENSVEWAIISFGIITAGAAPVNCIDAKTISSFKSELRDRFAATIFDIRDIKARSEFMADIKRIQDNHDSKLIILVTPEDYVFGEYEPYKNFRDFLDESCLKNDCLLPRLDPEAICYLFLTSGSTGFPKLCAWNHMALLNKAAMLTKVVGIQPDDIMFNDRPCGYITGYPYCMLHQATTVVSVSTKRTVLENNIEFVINVIDEEKANFGLISPYMVFDVAQFKHRIHLKTVLMGGQRISRQHLLAAAEFSDDPIVGFGSTETIATSAIFLSQVAEAIPDLVGYAFPGTEVKLSDDNGKTVPIGTQGEICIREHSIGSHYILQDCTEIHLTDKLGWLPTGDVGIMLPDGLVTICGRITDIIKRGLYKIFPSAVERILKQHSAVEDASVVGIKDERLYQELVAYVTVKAEHKLSEDDLRKFAREEFRPDLTPEGGLMPKHFVICKELPCLLTGKLDTKSLVIQAEKEFSTWP